MAWAQADIDALEAAIATDAKEVSYLDKTVRYNSAPDMLSLLKQMKDELAGTGVTARHSRVKFSRD